jgi:molybdopterin molybdotransferase
MPPVKCRTRYPMIKVEQALEIILGSAGVLEAEERPLLAAAGQVLSEDILAGYDVPPLDNSAMDGYAVRAVDITGARPDAPRYLPVTATAAAGSKPRTLKPGTAIRIMTGAPLPDGADAVVMFEDTDETDGRKNGLIGIRREIAAGVNIRRAGEDITRGKVVLRKGTVLGPAAIGVLASLGYAGVKVIRRPVVGVLATGNELTAVGRELKPGQIYNSNTYSVAALVNRYGGIPKILGIARDNEKSLRARLARAADCDLLITSGGVSKGDYDLVKDILAADGEMNFWQVCMKPGKPLAFGKLGNVPLIGLPGNPVSSMVSFEIFARPAMLKMMGRTALDKPVIKAVIDGRVVNRDGRRVYARAFVEKSGDGYLAKLTGPQGSGILTSMALGNGLAIVPEDKAEVRAGDEVSVLMLNWNEEL